MPLVEDFSGLAPARGATKKRRRTGHGPSGGYFLVGSSSLLVGVVQVQPRSVVHRLEAVQLGFQRVGLLVRSIAQVGVGRYRFSQHPRLDFASRLLPAGFSLLE